MEQFFNRWFVENTVVEIIVGIAISNAGPWSRRWRVLCDILGKAMKRTHIAHTACKKKPYLSFPVCVCRLGILSMGFFRGTLCGKGKVPHKGDAGHHS